MCFLRNLTLAACIGSIEIMGKIRALSYPLIQAKEVLFLLPKLIRYKIRPQEASNSVWLIEGMFTYPSFFNVYYYLKASFKLGNRPKIVFLNTALRFRKNRNAYSAKIMDSFTKSSIFHLPWKMMYRLVFNCSWVDLDDFQVSQNDKRMAFETFDKVSDKKELENLEIDGILVGDLIYDTYLRFKPAATVDLKDPFLLELLQITYSAIPYLKELIIRSEIRHLLTVYTSYLHHGLVSRIAIEMGISVHCIAVSHQLVARPTKEFPFHIRNFHRYREWFSKLPDPEGNLLKGKAIIDSRLSGTIDKSISYMRSSPYAVNHDDDTDLQFQKIKQDPRKKIVFMCHDFYDSPHCVGEMLFPDFYEWLTHCLSLAKKSPYQFIVKPHPNSYYDEGGVFCELMANFPDVVFLNKKTSNRMVKDLDIECVVTVYGTIAYEFAALGHRVICCGENPHSAYGFCKELNRVEELDSILTGQQSVEIKVNMNEIYEYLFVQNYRYDRGELEPFYWDFGHDALIGYLAEDRHRTELMMRAIVEVDSI